MRSVQQSVKLVQRAEGDMASSMTSESGQRTYAYFLAGGLLGMAVSDTEPNLPATPDPTRPRPP